MSQPISITVERRSGDFMAFIDDNRRLWSCGKTEAAAVLDVLCTHGADVGVVVQLPVLSAFTMLEVETA
jgi:hypothetical protein